MTERRLTTALIALLVVTSVIGSVAAPASALAIQSDEEAFTETARAYTSVVGETPDVVTFGPDQLPGWVVTYENGSEGDLRSWVDASTDRTIRSHDADSRTMVISAPATHVGAKWSLRSSTLRDLEYVELPIGINTRVEVDPITDGELETASSWSRPTGYWVATLGGLSGSLEADGAAWDDEVNETGLDDVREAIGADAVAVNGSGNRVAILDTGLTYDSDLHGDRVVDGKNVLTNETLNASANASDRDYSILADGNGHGDWVTTAAAGNGSGPNETGIAPGAEIVPVKVLADDGSGTTADIAAGLEFACGEANADVVSMSLGSAFASAQIESEIAECLDEDGVSAVVVAAGNNRMTYRFVASPGDSDRVVSVAATDARAPNESESAYFSAVGPDPETGVEPTIGAPGFKINLQTASGNRSLSGTSMATPLVSGAILLELESDSSKKGEPGQIRAHLEETASPIPNAGVTEVGAGRLNVTNLVDDVIPEETQGEAVSTDSEARDAANEALAGSFWRELVSG